MLYKLSKVLYILFLFYIGWFQDVFFIIPKMPLILGGGMIALLVLYKIFISKESSFVITKPVSIWMLFSFYVLLSGLFVAYDKSLLISSLFTYIQMLGIIIYIVNISVIEKNNNFFIKTYLFYSIIYMATMLFWGYNGPGERLYLSINSNPNGDALTLLFGLFCLLIVLDSRKFIKSILSFALIGLFVYTIILTGSRKSFIAAILLMLLWFIFIFKKHWKTYTINKKLLSLFFLSIILIISISKLSSVFIESTLYSRLIESDVLISGDRTRNGMKREAIQFFKDKPILGLGFNHYRVFSSYQTYSHSTYSEIISTTGLLGTMIYFYSYMVIIYNLLNIYVKTKRTESSIKSLQYLFLMFIMLVLGTGVIHFYGINDNIMFAMMISFYYTEKIKLKDIENMT